MLIIYKIYPVHIAVKIYVIQNFVFLL